MATAHIKSKISLDNSQFNKSMDGTIKKTAGFKKELSGMKYAIGSAFSVGAVSAFGVKSAEAAMTFEKAMRNVNSIARESEADFKKTTARVLEMSSVLGVQPEDLANALYDVNSAGFKGAEGLKVLEVAAQAGKAGLASTKDAAAAITGVLNAYGMSADKAGDISDVMFSTVKEGVITFQEMAAGLGRVTSTAASTGAEFDEVAAALATMTKSGNGSEESVTALNALLVAMLKPSKSLTSAWLDQYEVLPSVSLAVDGFAESLKKLETITGGDAAVGAKMLGNVRAMKAALLLTGKHAEAMAEAMKHIADEAERAGATKDALTEMGKSFSDTWGKVKAQMSVAMITIGGPLLQAFAAVLSVLGKIGHKMQLFSEALGYLSRLDFAGVRESLGNIFENGILNKAFDVVWKLNEAAVTLLGALQKLASFDLSGVKDKLSDSWDSFKGIFGFGKNSDAPQMHPPPVSVTGVNNNSGAANAISYPGALNVPGVQKQEYGARELKDIAGNTQNTNALLKQALTRS